jgi:hypothetical protein
MQTILLKNVKILEDENNLNKVDIFISGDKISAIGNFYNKKADKIIEGGGQTFVFKGFIDIYNQLDHNLSLFKKDVQEDLFNKGITKVICGHNGFSLAPILNPPPYALNYYTNNYGININWHSLKEFLLFLDKNSNGLNIKTFVGFDALKHIICGSKTTAMTKNEFFVFQKLLVNSLNEGALGLSLDWDDVLLEFVSLKQIEEIAKILRDYQKIFSISLPYLENIDSIINDIIQIVDKTKVKILLNDYLNNYLKPIQNINLLKKIYDFYPNIFLSIQPYPAFSILLYKLLPLWLRKNEIEKNRQSLNDEWLVKRIIEDLPIFDKEIMEIYELKNARRALFYIVKNLKLCGTVEYENVNFDVFWDTLLFPASLIGSGNFSFNLNKNIFSDFLSLILESQIISPNKAFLKIFVEPARFFGFNFKIKEGETVDLVGFNLKNSSIEMKFVISKNKFLKCE